MGAFPADSGSLALLSPETGGLEIGVQQGLPPDVGEFALKPGQGITGWVALHGKPLLVADVDVEAGTLVDVDRRMEIVRLGEGVDATGRLSDGALARTFAVCDRYAETLHELGAEKVRFVATSASRDAANRDVFVSGVLSRIGVEPEVDLAGLRVPDVGRQFEFVDFANWHSYNRDSHSNHTHIFSTHRTEHDL